MKQSAWIYLFIAIAMEVVATNALKLSEGFTKPFHSLTVIIGYAASFYLFSLSLKSIPVSVAYTIWAGLGIVLITIIGAIAYKEIPNLLTIIGIIFVISGIIIIRLFSNVR